MGYVYYFDEGAGIRKYYAHPDSSVTELSDVGTTGFKDDHEGISIYKTDSSRGYIIISDQQANQFRIFKREGSLANKHDHSLVKIVQASTIESEGNEVTSIPLPGFQTDFWSPRANEKTFQYYRLDDVMK